MRKRTTFRNRNDLDVRFTGERLYYGPETAKAYVTVSVMRLQIIAEREQALAKLEPMHRALRDSGHSYADTNHTLAAKYPELWEQAYPWHRLNRAGFELMREAAQRDTANYLAGTSHISCRTPKRAYEVCK